jgi:mannitol/fructose-specific phosphotransferase system IIA component (Ntr-type)
MSDSSGASSDSNNFHDDSSLLMISNTSVALDDKEIEWVFAIFVPQKTSDMHLEILSNLSRKLMRQAVIPIIFMMIPPYS